MMQGTDLRGEQASRMMVVFASIQSVSLKVLGAVPYFKQVKLDDKDLDSLQNDECKFCLSSVGIAG